MLTNDFYIILIFLTAYCNNSKKHPMVGKI